MRKGIRWLKGVVDTDSEMTNERVCQSLTQTCKMCDNKTPEKTKAQRLEYKFALN